MPLPFPFRFAVAVESIPVDFSGPYGRELRRRLDMREGVLHIDAMFETPGGRRTSVRTRKCASLADPHLLLQEVETSPENHWAKVEVTASLEEPNHSAKCPHLLCQIGRAHV